MTVATFQHWWGNVNPSKFGVISNFLTADGHNVEAAEYFREWLFSGTLFSYAEAGVRHGIVPWFMDDSFHYTAGWANTNWKTAMYIPTLFTAKTSDPAFPNFCNAVVGSWVGGGGPHGQGVSNKTFLVGGAPNLALVEGGSYTTPQQLYNAVAGIRQACYEMKPQNPPQPTWIGPNVFFQLSGFTGSEAWRNGPTFMAQWDALVAGKPWMEPTVYGFAIQGADPAHYQQCFLAIASYMAVAHSTKPFRITFANCPSPDINVQKAVMGKAFELMDANPMCRGTYWWITSNEFNYFYSPWTLVARTQYLPSGHFPWPYASTALGDYFLSQWNSRYTHPSPLNAPGTGVQPYPIDFPA